MYGISNSSATFSLNLASLGRMVQEILDKIGEIIKNTKVLLFRWHCSCQLTGRLVSPRGEVPPLDPPLLVLPQVENNKLYSAHGRIWGGGGGSWGSQDPPPPPHSTAIYRISFRLGGLRSMKVAIPLGGGGEGGGRGL